MIGLGTGTVWIRSKDSFTVRGRCLKGLNVRDGRVAAGACARARGARIFDRG